MTDYLQKTMQNLNKNGINTIYVKDCEQVIENLSKLIERGSSVAVGGSMSLFECGAIDFLRNGNFNFLDRYKEGLTSSEVFDIYIKSYTADYYLCSSNAITENGELYNVDGNSNRISAIAHGPKNVIMVVSVNKIVKNLDEAIYRVKKVSAPKNCVRLNSNTYCRQSGKCKSLLNESSSMTSGCSSDDRICCNYLVSGLQRKRGRITVVFVEKSLGY